MIERVVASCPHLPQSPYQRLLHDALQARSVRTVDCPALRPARLIRSAPRFDVLHLHWLEYIVHSNQPERLKWARTALRSMRLLIALGVLKAQGVRIVWTVHNLTPHESLHPRLDLLLARAVARSADDLIVHSRYAAERVRDVLKRGGAIVAPHPNFIGVYPPASRSREEVRAELGVPQDAHVVLAFGNVRPYKRLTELVQAFRTLDDPKLRLLVVGQPLVLQSARQAEAAARGDTRVLLRWERVPDAGVDELHRAADVAVIAYRDVFSSGVLLLALSCGLPVIAPEGGTATEVAAPPAVQPYEPSHLAAALARSRGRQHADGREAALAAARCYPWADMGETVRRAYA